MRRLLRSFLIGFSNLRLYGLQIRGMSRSARLKLILYLLCSLQPLPIILDRILVCSGAIAADIRDDLAEGILRPRKSIMQTRHLSTDRLETARKIGGSDGLVERLVIRFCIVFEAGELFRVKIVAKVEWLL